MNKVLTADDAGVILAGLFDPPFTDEADVTAHGFSDAVHIAGFDPFKNKQVCLIDRIDSILSKIGIALDLWERYVAQRIQLHADDRILGGIRDRGVKPVGRLNIGFEVMETDFCIPDRRLDPP